MEEVREAEDSLTLCRGSTRNQEALSLAGHRCCDVTCIGSALCLCSSQGYIA